MADAREVIVLGAGIVGLSTALHLQQRGHQVVVVDRAGVGAGASFGNAGIIQSEAVAPYAMPRDFRTLLAYGLNSRHEVRHRLRDLPSYLPFLWQYWRNSAPNSHRQITAHYAELIQRGISAHEHLAELTRAEALFRQGGWLALYRRSQSLDATASASENWRQEFGVESSVLDRAEVLALEPHVMSPVKGAVHWTGTQTLTDPGALLQAYAKYFVADGGTIAAGSAESLRADGPGWSVSLAEGVTRFAAPTVVVAAGAWSMALVKPYGIHVPLGIKRGYHQHYQPKGNAVLSRPIADEDGYVMAPMSAGIRLTTGAELAHPDAPPSYDQLRQTEHLAQQIFPLGEPVPEEPWMGLRPCSPDMLPLIGPIPKHDGLFAAFGHGHQGMTLGPITGQLMAELIIDGKTSVDITPFLPARYSR